ncbi:aminoglycoside phosphotransferase family protein [Cyanobium sp. ATX 6F1]|nr:aminoglycoside phosphotransferase family protein [Cyanobium sp. ATX 6F1]
MAGPGSGSVDQQGAQLRRIAARFALGGAIAAIEPLGNGNVNDTYRVTLSGDRARRFVLQRLNTTVFPHPERVMGNIAALGNHLEGRLAQEAAGPGRRWEVPRLIAPLGAEKHWVQDGDDVWRLTTYIEGAQSLETVATEAQAWQLGFGLGTFHRLLSDLPIEALADTLEGFHITPAYLAAYERALACSTAASCEELSFCQAFVAERSALAGVLETAKDQGVLRLRPIHGDPKVNNVMLDTASGAAIALVDLDTVKPGLIHYDIGDCCRSGCNPLGEETKDWQAVCFDPGRCEAILAGYLNAARGSLTTGDIAYLFDAIRLIAFELGLRFLTDHLQGDVYFKTREAGQNLDRALVQFQLTASIEAQEEAIRSLIERLR